MRGPRFVVVLGLAAVLGACSSGLEQAKKAAPGRANGNVQTGLFAVGESQRFSVTEHAAAGGVIPSAVRPREVIFQAFVTEARADTELGLGAFADSNAVADLFVAAVVREDVDPNAFSYSLLGKMRHPRCISCHSIDSDSTWVRRQEDGTFDVLPPKVHAGDPVDATIASTCATMGCHDGDPLRQENELIGDDIEEEWVGPKNKFDFRPDSALQLANRLRTMDSTHVRFDGRVHWALIGGDRPGGPASDDHDARDELEDFDGVNRLVPGGRAAFLDQVDLFRGLKAPTDTRDAIAARALVSRAATGNQTSDAAPSAPSVAYVPAPDFDEFSTNARAGTLYVAYVSAATDLIATGADTNGAPDVFLATLEVRATGASGIGPLALKHESTTLVSNQAGSEFVGASGISGNPHLDATGRYIVFESNAADLGMDTAYTKNNGAGDADIFLWDRTAGTSTLVSAAGPLPSTDGGNGDSRNPRIVSGGGAVVFDSEATSFDTTPPDGNGVRDVFLTTVGDTNFAESHEIASLTDAGVQAAAVSYNADLAALGEEVFVVFESLSTFGEAGVATYDDQNRDGNVGGDPVSNHVFLRRPTGADRTVLLTANALSPEGETGADGDSTRPRFGGNARYVAFETRARNLDEYYNRAPEFDRTSDRQAYSDENYFPDIILADLRDLLSAGGGVSDIALRGISVSVDAEYGNGESVAPVFGTFAGSPSFSEVGFVTFLTRSTNLGAADAALTDYEFAKGTPVLDPPLRFREPSPVLVWHAGL